MKMTKTVWRGNDNETTNNNIEKREKLMDNEKK
jgi:hypothetical protein